MDFRDFSWWTAERVSAAANVGILVITFFTAIAAIVAVYQTKKTIKQNEIARTEHSQAALESQKQQEEYNRIASESAKHQAKSVELQRESIERANRPMMTARYRAPKSALDVLQLEIVNVGRTIAYEVCVEFDPELPDCDLELLNENCMKGICFHTSNIEHAKSVFCGRKFGTWVPGQEVTAPFWVLPKDYKTSEYQGKSAEGIPASQGVRISYLDAKGEKYSDSFELDSEIWAGVQFHETESEKQRRAIEKISENLSGHLPKLTEMFSTFINRTTVPTKQETEAKELRKKRHGELLKELGFDI